MIKRISAEEMPPQEISEAAMAVERWFSERGIKLWEYQGLCSRNHAFMIRDMAKEFRKLNALLESED